MQQSKPFTPLHSPGVLGPDYDEEARKLFALLNLPPSGAANDESSKFHSPKLSFFNRNCFFTCLLCDVPTWSNVPQGYRNLDAVWKHPTTGGQVFIGNATASSSPQTQDTYGHGHKKHFVLAFQSSHCRYSTLKRCRVLRVLRERRAILEKNNITRIAKSSKT